MRSSKNRWWAALLLSGLILAGPARALTSQKINFGKLGNKTFGAAPFAVSATASSGLPVSIASSTATVCSVSGNTVTLVGAGTCTLRASQPGNAAYAPARDVNQSFSVAKADQTITFAALPGQTFDASPLAISATASSGLAVTFSSTTTTVCTVGGATVTFVKVGNCTIRASQAGNGNYNAAANVNQSFTIGKGKQTIAFGLLGDKTLGAPPFAVSATASSSLAVSFASLTVAVCTVNGSTVTLVAAGLCTIRASQAGNATYAAAPSVDQSFAVIAQNMVTQYLYDAAGNLTGVQRVLRP